MTGALSLLAGVLLGLLSADTPGLPWMLAAAVLLAARQPCVWRREAWPLACAALLAGQLLAQVPVRHWMERRLEVRGPDPRVLAEGHIASVPARRGAALQFDLLTTSLAGAPAPDRPRRLRIEWRDPHARPRVGERWRLLLRLGALEETRNFDAVDAARLAFRDGVHARARVLPSALNDLVALAPASLHTVRARLAARVGEAIADPDAAALVTALAVGLTEGLSRDQWRVFNATGTTHLVAISGLHVTLFAWLAFRAARLAWRVLPARRLVARETFALLLGLAAAGGYALLAGLSVPTQRTWIMLATYVCARLAARRVQPGRLWAVALILVLLVDARAPLAAGFWLSFIAVGVLLGFAGRPHAHAGAGAGAVDLRWREALRVQWLIMVALVPASLAIFGGVSLVGLVVNLAAIPIISLMFVPVVLAGALLAWLAPGWEAPFFSLAARAYEWLWPGLVACADLGDGAWALWRAMPAAPWWLLALPASLVWLCNWPLRLRATALCAVLPLAFAPTRAPPPGAARVDVLDAGLGVAVLVRTHSHMLVFDTGDAWNTRGARLATVVLPALDAQNVRRVDRLVLPTLNEDRARAVALLAAERGVGKVQVAGGWPGSGVASPCGGHWTWDGVDFGTYRAGRYCVLRMDVGAHSLLFAGDLDRDAEATMLSHRAHELAADVVLIGRQASELASSDEWIESVAPALAIASGGVDGAQGRQRVLARWRRVARVLDTRRDGALVLGFDAGGIELRAMARTARFPFHWRRSSAELRRPPV